MTKDSMPGRESARETRRGGRRGRPKSAPEAARARMREPERRPAGLPGRPAVLLRREGQSRVCGDDIQRGGDRGDNQHEHHNVGPGVATLPEWIRTIDR